MYGMYWCFRQTEKELTPEMKQEIEHALAAASLAGNRVIGFAWSYVAPESASIQGDFHVVCAMIDGCLHVYNVYRLCDGRRRRFLSLSF